MPDIYTTYIVFASCIFIFEIGRAKTRYVDFLTVANFFFVLCYIGVPIYAMLYKNELPFGIVDHFAILFQSIIGYICLAVGWTLATNVKTNVEIEFANSEIALQTLLGFAIFGATSAVAFTIAKGGIAEFASGALVRYGEEDGKVSKLDFLKNVVSILPFLSYLYFAIISSRNYYHLITPVILPYVIVVSISLFIMLGTSSRGEVATFFLLHGIVYLSYNKKFKLMKLLPIVAILVLITRYGKQFFYAAANFVRGEDFWSNFWSLDRVRTSSADDSAPFFFLFKEFSHPSISLEAAQIHAGSTVNFTYFIDFIFAITRIMPQRVFALIMERPDTVSRTNTQLLIGLDEASIPPGILASFYYAAGTVGIITGMFSYGFIGKIVDNNLRSWLKSSGLSNMFYIYFAWIFGCFVTNGDPNIYIYSLIWPCVIGTVLYLRR